MKKTASYLKWALILLFFAAAAALFSLFGSYTRTNLEKLYLTPGYENAVGWDIYVMDNGQRVFLTPQELFDIAPGRTYYISRILTQDLRDSGYTLVNLSGIRPSAVFLDGEFIYTNCFGINPKLDDTVFPADFKGFDMRGENTYCTLPENYVGRRLTIATEHIDYPSVPIVIFSSMTVGWAVHSSDTNSMIIPAAGFAATALIMFGIWLYGVSFGIREISTLFVISAAMMQSFSFLRQYGFYSPIETAMDTSFTVFVPIITALLPLAYFIFKVRKRRARILYGIVLGICAAASAALQAAEAVGGFALCGYIRNALIYFAFASLIVLAVSEAAGGNKLFVMFLWGAVIIAVGVLAVYAGSLAGEGYYSSIIRTGLAMSFLHSGYEVMNFVGMSLFFLSAFISFYSLISRAARIQTDIAVQNERLEQLDRDLAVQKQFYESRLSREKEIRSLRHDMDGHLSTLLTLLDENKYSEAEKYLSGVIQLHGERGAGPICENPYMNAVLTEYSARCRDNKVSLICHVGIGECDLPSAELCLILNNALENAVEASMKLPENKRRIKVQAAIKQNRFLLRISNRFEGTVGNSVGLPATEKKGKEHGYGLSNIRSAVQMRGGSMDCRTENGYFILDVQFPLS